MPWFLLENISNLEEINIFSKRPGFVHKIYPTWKQLTFLGKALVVIKKYIQPRRY